jgi:hypothetical protein
LATLGFVIAMPEVVTHRYDASVGICPNICSLPDLEASKVLDQLRGTSRPTLKPGYLARRRLTEQWLAKAATSLLNRSFEHVQGYFFLGDFSYGPDPSRPATLVVPLSALPVDAITFTLGDSMTVVEQASRRLYSFDEVCDLFRKGKPVANFAFSDKDGIQKRFIEVQLWETFRPAKASA